MDTDSAARRPDRSAPAPTVRVHADRVAPSQPLELTPSMAFAMIARDADAAAGVAVRTAPRATARGLVTAPAAHAGPGRAVLADDPIVEPVVDQPGADDPIVEIQPPVLPSPISLDLDVIERFEPAEEPVAEGPVERAADGATAAPRRRVRWWHRLLRRRAPRGCSMCSSTTLPCPLGHP